MRDEDRLIVIGNWSIHRLTSYGADYGTGIVHIPCNSWMRKSAKGRECVNCKKPIPDDIMGLWMLHNFDDMGEL